MTAARPDGFRLSLSTIYTAAAAASDRLITYKTDLIPLSPDISFTLQLRTLQFHNRNLLLHTPYPRANTSKPPTYNASTLIRDTLLTSYFVLFATIFFPTPATYPNSPPFPDYSAQNPPATTYQVAEDSLQVSVGRRAPGAARARQRHSHKRSKKKKDRKRFQRYIYKYTGARQSYCISTSPSSTPEPRSDSSRSMTSSSPPEERKEARALPLPFPAEPDPTDGARVSAQTSPTNPV